MENEIRPKCGADVAMKDTKKINLSPGRNPRMFVLIFSDHLHALGIQKCLQVPPFSKGRIGGIFL
jgi:hypothetical protein